MPGIRILGRRWRFASDDLVLPCALEATAKIAWTAVLIAALVHRALYSSSRSHDVTDDVANPSTPPAPAVESREPAEPPGWLVPLLEHFLVPVCACVVLLSAATAVLLALHSARGAPYDETARRYVPSMLIIKLLQMLAELAFNVTITMGVWQVKHGSVPPDTPYFLSLREVVVYNWAVLSPSLLIALIWIVLLFGNRRVSLHNRQGSPSRRLRAWRRRLACLCCCCLVGDSSRGDALSDVAVLLSDVFSRADFVTSDVLMALVLLRVRHKKNTRRQRAAQTISTIQSSSSRETLERFRYHPECTSEGAAHPEERAAEGGALELCAAPRVEKWMTLEIVARFMQLSMSVYGWPLLLYRHLFTGTCKLAPFCMCCSGCCRSPRSVRGDNCCECYLAAALYTSRLPCDQILYASFTDRIFEVPFMVCVDQSTSSVVLVLRGSMSFTDLVTDLAAFSEDMRTHTIPGTEGFKGHKGMVKAAECILRVLKEKNILQEAFRDHPTYSLVITGHSLGAGVAVILSLMLQPEYENLHCYAFSTPGCTVCERAAAACAPYTLTIGLGDDVILRISLESVRRLVVDMRTVLRRCKLPKYRVVLRCCRYLACGVPESALEEQVESSTEQQDPEQRVVELCTGQQDPERSYSEIYQEEQNQDQLILPGTILHITLRKIPDRRYVVEYVSRERFSDILVTPRMLLDHFPDILMEAIEKTLQQQQHTVQV